MWQFPQQQRPPSNANGMHKKERNRGKNTMNSHHSVPNASVGAVGSEPYQTQLDMTVAQNRQLKTRCEKLERENADLKQSVYRLTYMLSQATQEIQANQQYNGTNENGKDGPNAVGARYLSRLESTLDEIKSEELDQTLRRALSTDHKKNTKPFHKRIDLVGHTGSVYAVKFSKNGKFIASGSFDKSVRIWEVDAVKRKGTEVACFEDHSLNVSDVCWNNESTELLSGAYDSTAKLWNVETGQLMQSFVSPGFVQSIMFERNENNLFFVGSTKRLIAVFDKRTPRDPVRTLVNETGMVNCVEVDMDGNLISGDSQGLIKLWSIAEGKCIYTMANDPNHKPVSYLHLSPPTDTSPDQMLGVNSYDNVLRVYGYEPITLNHSSTSSLEPTDQPFHLKHSLVSHKNKNWPIKSSFFIGRNCSVSSSSVDNLFEQSKEEISWGKINRGLSQSGGFDSSMLLCTGSADQYAYIFDIGQGSSQPSRLVQRLEAHKDRVYAVDFHPQLPVLATCSADFTVKVWGPKSY